MKKVIKEYLSFSRKERIAVTILLLLMSAFIAAPYFYEPKKEAPVANSELAEFLSAANTPAKENPPAYPAERGVYPAKANVELFPFDPNTIGENEWQLLGISTRTTRTLMNYRAKGGRFKTAEDIRKIWGLAKADADRLIPYIQIAGATAKPESITAKPENSNEARYIPPPVNEIKPIDINTATVEEWKLLPGIGEVLSNRIVKFRDKSGGFLSIEHVRKTYGISDSLFREITPYLRFSSVTMPKLNLNTASIYDLRTKTGMPYNMAKAIVDFRVQNGSYTSLNDVRKAAQVPDSLFQKMALLIKTE